MVTTAHVLAMQGELETVLEARGFAYALLMQAFLVEPQREQIENLAETGAVRLFPFGQDHPAIQQGTAAVGAFLADPANRSAEAVDRLVWTTPACSSGPPGSRLRPMNRPTARWTGWSSRK